MFDTRVKSRTIFFTGLGASAVFGLTVEAGAATWEGGDHEVRQSIARLVYLALNDHAHYGASGTNTTGSYGLLSQGPWSGR